MKLNLPSKVTAALSLVAGVAATLNQLVFHVGSTWSSAISVGLVFLAGLGISPVFGQAFASKFKSLLHIGTQVSLLISSALAAVTVAVTTIHMDDAVKSAIVVVLTVLAGLGFAPDTESALA